MPECASILIEVQDCERDKIVAAVVELLNAEVYDLDDVAEDPRYLGLTLNAWRFCWDAEVARKEATEIAKTVWAVNGKCKVELHITYMQTDSYRFTGQEEED